MLSPGDQSQEGAHGAAQRESYVVLIVDDDPLVLRVTATLVEDLGYRAVEAQSPADGLAKLSLGLRADIIITDYLMPKMTGLQFAEHVFTQTPMIPIILLSGDGNVPLNPQDPRICRLTKPCGQRDLDSTISRLLRQAMNIPSPSVKFSGKSGEPSARN